MIERWAMVDGNGIVVNVCNWDGDLFTWQPPEGITMVRAGDDVGIGWTWDGQTWISPYQ